MANIDYNGLWSALQILKPSVLTDKKSVDNYSECLFWTIQGAEFDALAADAAAIAFLIANRKFIYNSSLANTYTLTYNGELRTFDPDTAYVCQAGELQFFLDNFRQRGITDMVEDVNGTLWFGGKGAVSFYYW